MSETLINDEETLYKHFVCDCGEIEHGMGVLLENDTIFLDWYVTPVGLWGKLKQIFEILTGQGIHCHEFLLRKEDVSELIDVLEKAKEIKNE